MTELNPWQHQLGSFTFGAGTDYRAGGLSGAYFATPASQPVLVRGQGDGQSRTRTEFGAADFSVEIGTKTVADRQDVEAVLGAAAQTPAYYRWRLAESDVTMRALVVVEAVEQMMAPPALDANGLSRYRVGLVADFGVKEIDAAEVVTIASGATETATNAGNYRMPDGGWWEAVITAGGGGCTGPKLVVTDADSGTWTFDAHDVALSAAQTLTITSRGKYGLTAVKTGAVDVLGSCRGPSAGTPPQPFPLRPGDNDVALSVLTGSATCVLTFRSMSVLG